MALPGDGSNNEGTIAIDVPSKDPQKNPLKKVNTKVSAKSQDDQKEMTEEAQKKKAEIDLLVERLQDPCAGVAKLALQTLSAELKGATSSMISVPLPLKFLRPYFEELETFYNGMNETDENKRPLADILSVLATTVINDSRKALQFSLKGTREGLTTWGPEYLRNITREIGAEFEARQEEFVSNAVAGATLELQFNVSDLLEQIFEIVPFYFKHHNEIDALDLLVEVQQLEAVLKYVDGTNYKRVTQYLIALANFAVSEEDFIKMLTVVFDIFMSVSEYCEAVRIALKLRHPKRVTDVINSCTDPLVRKQIGYLLAIHRWDIPEEDPMNCASVVGKDIVDIISNEWLPENYKLLAKELDVEEAKNPDDVYKTHLEERRRGTIPLDSAKQNLASTLVNAFVNAGFGTDTLMSGEDSTWLYKNKEHGMTSAAASLGSILLWDVDNGLPQIDKYQWSSDPFIKSGALMGFGLVCAGIKNECDPAFALLAEQLESTSSAEQTIGALIGLGFAHIGYQREGLLDLLVPQIIDTSLSVEISACAALTLGLSYLGTANETTAEALLQTLLERQMFPGQLDSPLAFFFALALGLLFLGQKDACDATIEALDAVNEHPIGTFTKTCLLGFAYAGTGDVTKVQHFLKMCVGTADVSDSTLAGETKDNDSTKATAGTDDGEVSTSSLLLQNTVRTGPSNLLTASNVTKTTSKTIFSGMEQSACVLSMALVSLGEDIGSGMILRMIDHMLQYGSPVTRKGIPLCLALLSTSAPKPTIVEALSKLTHDADPDVALNAILSLGLVGAGSNNSRIAELLRQLAGYYSKSPNALFLVRIAQGLLYLGKGLMTLSPVHSDRYLVHPSSLGCLLIVLYSSLFMKHTILSRYHYLLYFLVAGARPRMLMTVDENLKLLPVSVRVGQALDTAGVAGHPRTITGFQTHTTPVLLSEGERVELATNDYVPVASLPLEGVIILKPVNINEGTGDLLKKKIA